MEYIFLYEVIEKGGHVYLTYTVSEEKKRALEAEVLGKSVFLQIGMISATMKLCPPTEAHGI